ncbi:hypothetical protein [Roseivivax sp. CAU 1753]
MRAVLAPVLAILLALTSVELAIARGAPAVAGTVVLCGGFERQTITLDVNGKPVRQSQLCPDAVVAFFADTAVDLSEMVVALRHARVRHADETRRLAGQRRGTPRARGPPTLI